MPDSPDVAVQRRGRRVGVLVVTVAAVAVLASALGGWFAYQRYSSFGTVWADGAPPKIKRCEREWDRNDGEAAAVPNDLVVVGSTAGGGSILSGHTGCPDTATVIWVALEHGHFVSYSLSGGP